MLTLALKPSLASQKEMLAFLVVAGGREIQKALNDKPAPGEITDGDPMPEFDNALLRLDHHFTTGTNAITDIIRFRSIMQKKNEQFIDFIHRLQEHASYCDFGEAEEHEIMIQIRQGAIFKQKLGEMMTRENKSLAEVINYGSSLDAEMQEDPDSKRSDAKDFETEVAAIDSRPQFQPRMNSYRQQRGQNRFRPYYDPRRAPPRQQSQGNYRFQQPQGGFQQSQGGYRQGANSRNKQTGARTTLVELPALAQLLTVTIAEAEAITLESAALPNNRWRSLMKERRKKKCVNGLNKFIEINELT